MTYLVGFLLLVCGILSVIAMVADFKTHGALMVSSGPKSPVGNGGTVVLMVLTGVLIMGGVYLLFPADRGVCLL